VHALYCVIALMITSLLRRQLAQAGISVSLARMLERLADTREVSLIYHDAQAKSRGPKRFCPTWMKSRTKSSPRWI